MNMMAAFTHTGLMHSSNRLLLAFPVSHRKIQLQIIAESVLLKKLPKQPEISEGWSLLPF